MLRVFRNGKAWSPPESGVDERSGWGQPAAIVNVGCCYHLLTEGERQGMYSLQPLTRHSFQSLKTHQELTAGSFESQSQLKVDVVFGVFGVLFWRIWRDVTGKVSSGGVLDAVAGAPAGGGAGLGPGEEGFPLSARVAKLGIC